MAFFVGKACEILLLHARSAVVRRYAFVCSNLSHPSPAVILSVGATERLRETRRATVSRTRSDLAAHDVRTNSRLFLGNMEYFIFVGFPCGSYFFVHTKKKISAGKASNTPSEIPSSSRAAYGFAAFLGFAPFRMATLRKTSRATHAQDDTESVCAAVCVCLRTTDGRPYGKHGAPIRGKSNIGENSGLVAPEFYREPLPSAYKTKSMLPPNKGKRHKRCRLCQHIPFW